MAGRGALSRVMSSRLAARAASRSWSRSSSWRRRSLMFEVGDALFELVGVVGGAEPGVVPCLGAERLGETLFELADPASETSDALLGVEQLGLQGRPGEHRRVGGGGLCRGGVDLFEEVAVAVEEAAVDAGVTCDAADGDLVSLVDRVVEGFEGALAAAAGVVALSFRQGVRVGGGHGLGSVPGRAAHQVAQPGSGRWREAGGH